MRTIFKILLLVLSHIIVAILCINLSFMPPTMTPLRNFVLSINPIARALHVEQLSSSTHRGLILKSAIQLGIFEIFGDTSSATSSGMTMMTEEEKMKMMFSGPECLPIEEIQARLSMKYAHEEENSDDDENNNNNNGNQKAPPSLDALKDMLEALSTMSLVDICEIPSDDREQESLSAPLPPSGYSPSLVSRIHLNGRGRGSVRRRRISKKSEENENDIDDQEMLLLLQQEMEQQIYTDDWSGMILTANSDSVIESLNKLTERLTKREGSKLIDETTAENEDFEGGSSLSISRKQESELWKGFAANTHEIFTETAQFSAQEIMNNFLFGGSSSKNSKYYDNKDHFANAMKESKSKKQERRDGSTNKNDEIVQQEQRINKKNNLYFDIGAGSAVVAEEFCRQLKQRRMFSSSSPSSSSYSSSSYTNPTSWKYILVDLPEVVNYLNTHNIHENFCQMTSIVTSNKRKRRSFDDEENDDENVVHPNEDEEETAVSLVEANATSGELFSKAIREALEKNLLPSSSQKKNTVIFSLNSFLQHFDDDACLDILTRLFKEASNASKKSVVVNKIIFSIMELENPRESYNPWSEWLPAGRIFTMVLRAFTNSGSVRYEGEYGRMLEKVVHFSQQHGEEGNTRWMCDVQSTRKVPFPLPASVSMIQCELLN